MGFKLSNIGFLPPWASCMGRLPAGEFEIPLLCITVAQPVGLAVAVGNAGYRGR